MHFSRQHYVKSSLVLCCNAGSKPLTDALLRCWREMRAAAPASATASTASLLDETLTHLQVTAPVTTTELTSSSSAVPTLFSSPEDAQIVWNVVQRQRVSWRAALQLLPWQLQEMSAAQRSFVSRRVASSPWHVAHIVLAAGDVVDDARLVQTYGALKRATYMVEFARLISAALRERPSLPEGLLPVPYGVMLHGYELGRRSPQDAAMALKLSQHLTLLGRSALSRSAEERLVLGHACLEGQAGNWAAALEVVARSRAVRLSIRKGFERFVQATPREVPTPSPESGLSSISSSRDNASSFPSSAFGSSAEEAGTQRDSTWLSACQAFLAQPPDRQTYAEAHSLLATLPKERTERPDFVVLAVEVLRHAARRMYAGSLTRRLVSSTKKAEWGFALSLASAARYYDMAVPLLPFLPQGTELPLDLKDFLSTTQRIEGNVDDSDSAGSSLPPLTRAAAEKLSYPQALAYALKGDAVTRQTLLSCCPQSQSLSPLRSLLLAARRAADDAAATNAAASGVVSSDEAEEESMSDVDCCTFQSSSLSQLVCAAASEKRQRYFYKVIPASARAHHFGRSSLSNAPVGSSTEVADRDGEDWLLAAHPHTSDSGVASVCHERLQRWRERVATTPADCAALLADLSAFLRATHTIEGAPILGGEHAKPRLTEDVFWRWVAAFAAWGTVQLTATERFYWPLAVLRSACLLRVTLDASLVSAAVRSIPSMFVDDAALALPCVLASHTLLGNWKAGLQVCARLERKEKAGAVRLEAPAGPRRPHTVKYKPPPPSLREAMAQVGYAAPAKDALRHWTELDASLAASSAANSFSFPLMLIELKQFHDTRQLCEKLHATVAVAARPTRMNAKLEHLSRRRMLLGAAFSLLDDEAALENVVRAGGDRQVRADDLDVHGLQRLLGVLPAATVSRVLTAEAATGRCAQEHWLLSCMSHPSISAGEARPLARLRPASSMLSAVSCFRAAVEKRQPVLSIKALRRIAEGAVDSPVPHALLRCIARLLRVFLSNDDLLQACVRSGAQHPRAERSSETYADDVAKDALRQAQMLFNRLQEVEQLSGALKHARRVVRHAIEVHPVERASGTSFPAASTTTPCATWVLLSSLHVAMSRVLHLPIPASFTSHLFLLAAAAGDAADWRAALLLFNVLQRPTDAERAALVRVLRQCGATATSLLLPHRRFMRHLPEQLMVWADEASGPSKWERSITLLMRVQGNEMDAQVGDGASPSATTREEREQATPADAFLSPDVLAAITKWNADECFRAAQLLRRQGFLRLPAKRERSLEGAQVTETDPHARRQVEAILKLLRKGTAKDAAAPTPSSPKVPSPPSDVVRRK
ncbi:hypothetical protein ABB37_03532 [Leptomonas pyrrhocoris]|uniref:Uncharacterized protein n=1 Tax=Leptomonas pyrrhocoris TaxID=157538 RepID=A0A0N0DX30_LEPPY|nr:hypothetical protein ABB37_03532 [Leptomonas pyrrhocoris]KPA82471.1 hypothetical protein ABB37_03532 [Leptomonas pyrrhocoris]|eukprot:XP_015660910.1 hypothetical protein ABB37_03532 [Leptomonas pyrrhocoris]